MNYKLLKYFKKFGIVISGWRLEIRLGNRRLGIECWRLEEESVLFQTGCMLIKCNVSKKTNH